MPELKQEKDATEMSHLPFGRTGSGVLHDRITNVIVGNLPLLVGSSA